MTTSAREDGLVWADRSEILSDILQDSDLPLVVKMSERRAERRDPAGALLSQPLLLYRELKGFKVIARNVSSLQAVPTSKGGVEYREGGSVIVLPVDYQGWFRILDDNSVPVLNVANLARIMPVLFLSVKKFPCFSLLDPLNKKDFLYEKLFFPPGLYRLVTLFEDYVKYKNDRGGNKKKLLRCLVCESQNGIHVLVPFDVTGEFYVVEHKKSQAKAARVDTNARAYTIPQLLALEVFTKPLALKLLHGDQPNRPCGFTGIIKVVDIIEDWTVVAMILDKSRKLIELPVAPFPEFRKALNGKDLLESGSLRSEYQYLKDGAAEKYAKEIKVREKIAMKDKEEEQKRKKANQGRESRVSKTRELRPVRGTPRR